MISDWGPITAVIKTRNEASQIADAVASARLLASTVIIVDDSSTDSTVRIAEAAGAVVVKGMPHGGRIDLLDLQGFLLVREGWILRMDADERVTGALARELLSVAQRPDIAGVAYARLNYFFGRGLRHGGWMRPQQLGFFRRSALDTSWDGAIHSQVPVSGRVVRISPRKAVMLHLDYDDVLTFVERSLVGYAAVEALSLDASGSKAGVATLCYRPLRRFFGRYVLRMGFLDGRAGFITAVLLAIYDFVSLAMVSDSRRRRGGQ